MFLDIPGIVIFTRTFYLEHRSSWRWSNRPTILEMSKQVVSLGGSIAGEHGIGKIKSKYLEMAVGKDAVRQIKQIKKCLDPNNIPNHHALLRIEN